MNRIFSTLLFRYLSRQFLIWFAAVFLVLAFLVWSIEIVELVKRAGTKQNVSFLLIIQMSLLKLPSSLQKIFLFTILFASLITFMRLSKTSELPILRSAGLSIWQLLLPIFTCALAIGYLNIFIINPLSAALSQKYDTLNNKYLRQQQSTIDISETGLWLKEINDDKIVFFHAKSISQNLSEMHHLTTYFVDDFMSNIDRVEAEKAILRDEKWVFINAYKHFKDAPPKALENFSLPTSINQSQIQDSFIKASSVSFWKLPKFIKMLEKTGLPNMRHKLYFHNYLAQPFSFLVMVTIGVLFSTKHHRFANIFKMTLMGILAGVCYFILQDFLLAMGLSENIPVLIAAWSPILIGLSITIPFLIHQEDG